MEKSNDELVKGVVPQVRIVKSVLDLVGGHPTGGGGGGPGDDGGAAAPGGIAPVGPATGDCDW